MNRTPSTLNHSFILFCYRYNESELKIRILHGYPIFGTSEGFNLHTFMTTKNFGNYQGILNVDKAKKFLDNVNVIFNTNIKSDLERTYPETFGITIEKFKQGRYNHSQWTPADPHEDTDRVLYTSHFDGKSIEEILCYLDILETTFITIKKRIEESFGIISQNLQGQEFYNKFNKIYSKKITY